MVLLLVAGSIVLNVAFRDEVDDGPQIEQKPPTSDTRPSPFRYDPEYPQNMYDNDIWGNPLVVKQFFLVDQIFEVKVEEI